MKLKVVSSVSYLELPISLVSGCCAGASNAATSRCLEVFRSTISTETEFERSSVRRWLRNMPSSTYTLFRNAILAQQQVVCTYGDLPREICPHIIGTNRNGEEVVLGWQFAGRSSGKLPQWRCLKLANVKAARARDGHWHEGGSHKTEQRCVTAIDLDINVHVRKLR